MTQRSLPLRPMTVGNILDYSIQIYCRNFWVIMGFSLLIGGLFNLLMVAVSEVLAPPGYFTDSFTQLIDAIKSGNFEAYMDQIPEPQISPDDMARIMMMIGGTWILSIVHYLLVNPFVQGGVINLTGRYLHGTKLSMSDAFKETGGKLGRLVVTALSLAVYYIGAALVFMIVSMILFVPLVMLGVIMTSIQSAGAAVGFVILLLLAFVVFIIMMIIIFMFVAFTYPVAIAEPVYHFRAMGRSFKLVSKKFWRVFGIIFLVYLLVYMIVFGVAAIGFLISLMGSISPMFQQILTVAVTALVAPIAYIATTLLYYDIRIRVEGYGEQVPAALME
jgi:hypothetical protein